MTTVYVVDARNVFTGEVIEKSIKDPIKRNEIMVAPPEGEGFHIWDGRKWFTRQEYPHPVYAEPEPIERKISVGQFFDSFGEYKWAILASDNPMVQALIKDSSVREHITLDDPSLRTGLELVVEAGFDIDIDAILGQGVVNNERDRV